MGALHRRIEIASRELAGGAEEARTVVEDDFHHFRVTVRQRGGVVTDVVSQSLRNPTVLCPSAGERLSEILGMPLDGASVAVHKRVDARLQCTHMIDLAGLAVAALALGRRRRVYEATVPDREDGRTRASLRRDGRVVLEWELDHATIKAPPRYAGIDIGAGFTQWASDRLDAEAAEAALVLRRAVFISRGRGIDLDAPARRRTGPIGGCWVWQPERAAGATRNIGSALDFTGREAALTQDDRAWLAFDEAVEESDGRG
jgi:hypothetical protein